MHFDARMDGKDESKVMGGIARAKAMTPGERKESAQIAAAARWDLPKATHRGEVRIGDSTIPCYVLQAKVGAPVKRMLSQTGMVGALGISRGGPKNPDGTRGDRLANFSGSKVVSPFVSEPLRAAITNPVKFLAPGIGMVHGYEATILHDICDAVLTARKAGALQKQQLHIADQCEILVRGFARVGIISLVDEASGYQDIRDRQALQAILDQYLAKELAAWARRFPDEFYQEIFRLRGWEWRELSAKRPILVGKLTKDVVYERLAPGIVKELEARNPKDERGYRKAKHHQWMTADIGHPALSQHLHAVIGFMRASRDWKTFKDLLDRAFPKKGETLLMPHGWRRRGWTRGREP